MSASRSHLGTKLLGMCPSRIHPSQPCKTVSCLQEAHLPTAALPVWHPPLIKSPAEITTEMPFPLIKLLISHACVYAYVYVFVCVCLHVYVYVCVFACVHVCVYMCTYVCVRLCVCVSWMADYPQHTVNGSAHIWLSVLAFYPVSAFFTHSRLNGL